MSPIVENPVRLDPFQEIVDIHFPTDGEEPADNFPMYFIVRGAMYFTSEYGAGRDGPGERPTLGGYAQFTRTVTMDFYSNLEVFNFPDNLAWNNFEPYAEDGSLLIGGLAQQPACTFQPVPLVKTFGNWEFYDDGGISFPALSGAADPLFTVFLAGQPLMHKGGQILDGNPQESQTNPPIPPSFPGLWVETSQGSPGTELIADLTPSALTYLGRTFNYLGTQYDPTLGSFAMINFLFKRVSA